MAYRRKRPFTRRVPRRLMAVMSPFAIITAKPGKRHNQLRYSQGLLTAAAYRNNAPASVADPSSRKVCWRDQAVCGAPMASDCPVLFVKTDGTSFLLIRAVPPHDRWQIGGAS